MAGARRTRGAPRGGTRGALLAAALGVFWSAGGGAGCQATLLTIDLDRSSTTTVKGGIFLEDWLDVFGFGDFLDMDLTDAQELKNQGVAPGDIKDTHLVRFELEATHPAGADLSFLSEMTVYVSAPDLPQVEVAHADSFPDGQKVVSLQVEGVDLTAYLTSEKMTLTTKVRAHHPRDDTEVQARFRLRLDVTLQGAAAQL